MRRAVYALVLLTLSACGDDGRTELWIYTSIYPEVIRQMEPELAKAFPDVRFRWYQKGSEQVAARLNVEFAAGKTPCDLLMTSDPFYYLQLKQAGRLLMHESDATAAVPADLKDPDGAFATIRIPLMVIAVNADQVAEAERPSGFRDLTQPRFKGKLSMGDPLKSGTTFTTVAALAESYDWGYFEALRTNDAVSAGGNSTVLHDIETGARPVGIILLENLLPSIAKGAPIDVVYPDDGAVPVPSPIAILAASDEPDLARRVYDFMFSEAMQKAIVAGHMYSPLPALPPPDGARAWSALKRFPWTNDFLASVSTRRDEIKKRFRAAMR